MSGMLAPLRLLLMQAQKPVATGSAPVAMANGFADGENVSLEFVLDNIKCICAAVDLPVSMDFKGAYSADPAKGGANFARAIQAGAIGFNFEDQIVGGEGLHSVEVQSLCIKAAREAIDATGVNAFINVRTDLFLKAKAAGEPHTEDLLTEAIERAKAYADAGADGFFASGLLDIKMIERLCEQVPLPVNIIALPGAPKNSEMAKAGVARISYGPVPHKEMVKWFTEEAKDASV